jgi:hypothetical protein
MCHPFPLAMIQKSAKMAGFLKICAHLRTPSGRPLSRLEMGIGQSRFKPALWLLCYG